MTLGGQCQSCGKYVSALVSCGGCGSRVCHQCIEASGFCKLCKGIKRIR